MFAEEEVDFVKGSGSSAQQDERRAQKAKSGEVDAARIV